MMSSDPDHAAAFHAPSDCELLDRPTLECRIYWRSSRRGFKEADLLIGGFAAAHVPAMNTEDLVLFEHLLAVPDQDLYAWVMGHAPAPAMFDHRVLQALQAYGRLVVPTL